MALWIQPNVVKTNWKTRIKSPRQLETEVGKIFHQKSQEVSDMKKLPQIIFIGARHCGVGHRLLLHDFSRFQSSRKLRPVIVLPSAML